MNNNTAEIPTRIEGPANYAFKAGLLEGAFLGLQYAKVPGIEITDSKAFESYIESKLVDIHNRAVKFERGEY